MQVVEATYSEIATARHQFEQRRARDEQFVALKLPESAWDMLLFLFIEQEGLVTTGELCRAARVPHTTGLRHIADLVNQDMAYRTGCIEDGRVQHVKLTRRAIDAMRLYLTTPIMSD